jgi:nucleoside-diphosphate-sugar epimerase
MNILITGASGFLGSILVNYLRNDFNTYTLARSKAFFNCNLTKECNLFNYNFDLVVHAAGKAHTLYDSDSDIDECYQVNVIGTKNLLEELSKSGIPKCFVFISSVAVYGQNFGNGIGENFSLSAKDHYGLSKIEAENLIWKWCEKNNVICSILRLPLIVGPNPPGNLGAMIEGIRKRYYFNIAGGKARKSMVLAEDVAKIILRVSEIGGIYNLTDGYHPSFCELSNHISNQLGKRKPINVPLWLAIIFANIGDLFGKKVPFNTKKLNKITSDLTFDNTKATNSFDWKPTPVLEGFTIQDNS